MALATVSKLVAIRQQMQSGSHFGGSAPDAGSGALTPVLSDDTYKFSAGTIGGGLFAPSDTSLYAFRIRQPLTLVTIELDLGGQTTWSVTKEDIDGNAFLMASGTTEAAYVSGDVNRIALLYGDSVKVVTAGGTVSGLTAILKFEPRKNV